MRKYQAEVHLGGDRNHVVVRKNMFAPELAVLQAIHGTIAVQKVSEMPNQGIDKTPHSDVIDQLNATYGRVRIGDGDDRRSVLRAVFPTWPNVPNLPTDARSAGVSEENMLGGSPADKAQEAAMRERIRKDLEQEAAEKQAQEDAEEFARREKQEQEEREQAEEDTRSDLQKLKDHAAELGVPEKDIKAAGKSKIKLGELIEAKQAELAEGDNDASTEQNEEEEEAGFMS